MKDDYCLSAAVYHRRDAAALERFVEHFGARPGVDVERRALIAELHLGYDPVLLAEAMVWAEAEDVQVVIEESFERSFEVEDCLASSFCRLRLPEASLSPEIFEPQACPRCKGYLEIPNGRAIEAIDFEELGEAHGALYVNAELGAELSAGTWSGLSFSPCPQVEGAMTLRAETIVDELLVEGENVFGLAEEPCADCGRSACRHHPGPSLVAKQPELEGLDVIATRYLGFESLAFSPALAKRLCELVPGLEPWEPLRLREV